MAGSQEDFLKQEFWILAWNASVQRSNLYRKDVEEKARADFRELAIQIMDIAIFQQYKTPVSEAIHCANIEAITEAVTTSGVGVLGDSGYRIGVAQKAFNLILKYYWCAGFLAEPPHCPVDRIILGKTALKSGFNWTQIVSIDEYKNAIGHIRSEADKAGLSIAQWELKTFNRRNG